MKNYDYYPKPKKEAALLALGIFVVGNPSRGSLWASVVHYPFSSLTAWRSRSMNLPRKVQSAWPIWELELNANTEAASDGKWEDS